MLPDAAPRALPRAQSRSPAVIAFGDGRTLQRVGANPQRVLGAPGLAPAAVDGRSGTRGVSAIDRELATLTVKQKVALVVMEYGDWRYAPGSGGVIVTTPHLSAAHLDAMKAIVRQTNEARGLPLLVAADQEGGQINRLRRTPGFEQVHFASPAEMQKMSPEQIEQEGEKTGRGLAAAGVNMLLGPVLDVADHGTLMAKMGRSFGTTSTDVTERAKSFVAGVHAANPNILLVAKHYPGYDVRSNSDITPATDDASASKLAERSAPFFDVPGIAGVMMSSVTYPALDDQPACFSHTIIAALHKKRPDWVVMTDDLAARGLLPEPSRQKLEYLDLRGRKDLAPGQARKLQSYEAAHPDWAGSARDLRQSVYPDVATNAQRAFEAGADQLLVLDAAAAEVVRNTILGLVRESPKNMQRLNDSVRRVLRLRQRLKQQGAPSAVSERPQALS